MDKTGGVLQSPPATATEMVSCCMVLHNLAIRSRMGLEILEEDDEEGDGNLILRRIVEDDHFVPPHNDNDDDLELNDPQVGDRQMNREGQRV